MTQEKFEELKNLIYERLVEMKRTNNKNYSSIYYWLGFTEAYLTRNKVSLNAKQLHTIAMMF